MFESDIREADLVAEAMVCVDIVFHEAAVVSVERSIEAPRETNSVNVDATLALLELAREEDARVVYASSAAGLGQPESVPISEDDRRRPTNPYGVSKLAAEEYCRLYWELYAVETVVLRYFNVYGPWQSGEYSGGD